MSLIAPASAAADVAAPTAEMAADDRAAQARGLRQLYEWHWYVAVHLPSGDESGVKARNTHAMAELHRCFNCSFPVAGAPHNFPRQGQFIPLKACVVFFCKNAPVKAWQDDGGHFHFIAQKGHFDGAGSEVHFYFWTDSHGYLRMTTRGYVTHPSIPDDLNREGAYQMWHNFALKLGEHLWERCGWTCR
ncbi:hypothetical protein ACIRYZ_44075 [Kitasatospora sp. NPDC101155]|uniref:hypothetical protein n=1 Tax=Kitasatospora sp. NPDC101155 TaxID=3364097 RepID=UPI00380A0331